MQPARPPKADGQLLSRGIAFLHHRVGQVADPAVLLLRYVGYVLHVTASRMANH
jgi:hypothetical protein